MIGDRILLALEENGKSKADFARDLAVYPQYINTLIKRDDIKLSLLRKISVSLNKPLSYFLDEESNINTLEEEYPEYKQEPLFLEQRMKIMEEKLEKINNKLDL
jgi:transcriptional regulator with XRE-family HTH domain